MQTLPPKRAGVPPAGRLKPRSQSCTTRAQTQLGMHHYVQAYRITHNYCGHHRSPEIFRCVKPPKLKSSNQQLAQRRSNMLQLAASPSAAQASKGRARAHIPILRSRAWHCAKRSQRSGAIGTCFPTHCASANLC